MACIVASSSVLHSTGFFSSACKVIGCSGLDCKRGCKINKYAIKEKLEFGSDWFMSSGVMMEVGTFNWWINSLQFIMLRFVISSSACTVS